jgi:serine/threonine-protein kinase
LERLTSALADRYRLERELGAGGMATVYLAEDLKHQRKVAVKVLRADLAASLGPERFLREVTIAANLTHPHILPLHDSGEVDGFLYYVMPYVEGTSLRQKLIREGELPIPEAVRILRDVADAMAYAHQHGVVHRDIKPENVMLSGRHALVTDFGVAKAVSEATGRQTLTTAGVALGTPAYMAPEQAAADPHTDHRADIYAFGVVAYELLTGRPPFTGASPQAMLAAHVTMAPDPVSKYRPSIPPALAALVMRCLEKLPADRWQSADELIPHLEAVLTPSGGMTPTATVPVTAVSARRPKWPLALVAAAVLLAVAVALWLPRGGGPGAAPPVQGGRVAVFPFEVRSTDSADVWLGEGLAEQVGSRLAKGPALRVLSTNAIASQLRKTPDPLDAAHALEARWAVTGLLRRTEGEIRARVEIATADSGVQAWSGSFTRTDGDFRLLEAEVAESVSAFLVGGPTGAATTVAGGTAKVDPEAYRHYLLANAQLNRRTADAAMQAVANYQAAVDKDPGFATGWAGLGYARIVQYSWGGWRVDVPRDSLATLARVASARALSLDSRNVKALVTSGMVSSRVDGNYTEAFRVFEQALRLDSLDAEAWHAYGVSAGTDRANDHPLAERLLRRAVALDPDRPNTWRDLAMVVAWQGRLVEAEAILDTVVALGVWAPGMRDRAYVKFLRGNPGGALEDQRASDRIAGVTDSVSMALYRLAAGDSTEAKRWASRSNLPMSVKGERLLVVMGRPADAMAMLERIPGKAERWARLHDPILAPLRAAPRFQRLVKDSRPPGAPEWKGQ